MIMLMNDREELADGSYLKEGTLYNQWGSEEHITDQAAMGMALLAKKGGTDNDSIRHRLCF